MQEPVARSPLCAAAVARLLLVLPALLQGCSAEQGGSNAFCTGDGDCPAGTSCVFGQCLPGEYAPLPRTDLGPAPTDAGPDGEVSADGGGPDAGGGEDGGEDVGPADGGVADGGGGGGDDLGGLLAPLELSWLEPAEGARVEGEIDLRFALRADPRLRPRLLTVVVDGVDAAKVGRPEAAAPVVVRLATTSFADGTRTLAARILDDGGRNAAAGERRLLFVNHPGRLQLDQGRFFLDGAPAGLLGLHYAVAAEEAVLDADLTAMATAGINLIAADAPSVGVEPAENSFILEGCAATTRLLERAEARGIHVLLVMPPWSAYPWLRPADPAAGAAAPLWDGKLRSALARRYANQLERCGWVDRVALAAADLWRSPRLGSTEQRQSPSAIQAWDGWSLARHGSAEARAAAWGAAASLTCGPAASQACPPSAEALCDASSGGAGGPARWVADYREFVASAGRTALQDLVQKVRLAAPTLLLTAGLDAPAAEPIEEVRRRCAADGGALDPRALAAPLDFLLLLGHPWQGVGQSPLDEATPLPPELEGHASDFDLLELSVLWSRRSSQPVVLGGFTADASLAGGGDAGEQVQAGVWGRMLQAARGLALGGVLGATWRDPVAGGAPQTGLVAPDGHDRAALAVLQQEGPALKSPPAYQPDAWLAVPAERVHHLAEAVLAARPFYLALRGEQKRAGATGCTLADGLSCPEVRGCSELCSAAAGGGDGGGGGAPQP